MAYSLYHRSMAHLLSTKVLATSRELDTLRGIWAGLTNKGIAASLKLSVKTIELHRFNLNKKLHVHNTAGLIREGLKHRLITP